MSFVAPITLSDGELALLDGWQRNFPLVERPFSAVGRAYGLNEDETIATFARLQAAGALVRIGAVVRPNMAGASTLAAMQVPPARIEEVGAAVSREPLVNHNYARTHPFNLWFVVAGPDTAAVAATLRRIGQQTGLEVLDLPLVKSYHLDLGFLFWPGRRLDRRHRPTLPAQLPMHPMRATAACLPRSRTACLLSHGPTGTWRNGLASTSRLSSPGCSIFWTPAW